MSLSNFVGPHPTSQEDPIVTQTECLSSHFPAHMVLYQDLQCSSRSPTVIMTQAAPKKCFRLLTRTFRRHMQPPSRRMSYPRAGAAGSSNCARDTNFQGADSGWFPAQCPAQVKCCPSSHFNSALPSPSCHNLLITRTQTRYCTTTHLPQYSGALGFPC